MFFLQAQTITLLVHYLELNRVGRFWPIGRPDKANMTTYSTDQGLKFPQKQKFLRPEPAPGVPLICSVYLKCLHKLNPRVKSLLPNLLNDTFFVSIRENKEQKHTKRSRSTVTSPL